MFRAVPFCVYLNTGERDRQPHPLFHACVRQKNKKQGRGVSLVTSAEEGCMNSSVEIRSLSTLSHFPLITPLAPNHSRARL